MVNDEPVRYAKWLVHLHLHEIICLKDKELMKLVNGKDVKFTVEDLAIWSNVTRWLNNKKID